MSEKRDEKTQTCGYGLIGLCCSDCLLGPCRISPFEKEAQRGICDDPADGMVVKNLFRKVTGEAWRGLADLKEALQNLLIYNAHPTKRKQPIIPEQKGIFEKYACPSGKSKKIQIRYLSKEMEKLFSIFLQGKTPLLENLFPLNAFPFLTRSSFLSGSWVTGLLDIINRSSNESTDIETLLEQCLQVSILTLLCEELRQDIHCLISEERISQSDQKIYDMIRSLPKEPSPMIVLLSNEKSSSREWVHRTAQSLEKDSAGKLLTFSIDGIEGLRELGKRLSERWPLPVSEMKIVALISSSMATWVLGAMALGFSVISYPALPIHGSERAEHFFSEVLKKEFGNPYFFSWREDVLNELLEFLK